MSRVALFRRIGLFIAMGALWAAPAWADEAPAQRREALDEAFRKQLAEIASKCDELGLAEQARITRAWFIPRDPSRLYVFLPDGEDETPPREASKVVRYWHEAWMKARHAHAASLFQLAKSRLDRGDVRTASMLLHEALHEDPAHAEVRRILGPRISEPPQARPVRTPNTKFGWPAGKHWRVVTDRYEVRTDHSAEEGVRLAQRLEELHAVWRQVFAEYWLSEADLRRAWEGGSLPGPPRRKLQVVLFRDREEYVRQLQQSQPQIGITEGYYAPGDWTAYFFAGDDGTQSTWRHEGTHQILYETGDSAPRVGHDCNFWVVEAAALYMESLAPHDGYYTVGGFDALRLQYARLRALNQDFQTPLADLTRLGRDNLQEHPEIRQLYSQAAGLAHFFLDGENGRCRRPFLHYLAAVHQGRDRPESLAQMMETDYADLDRRYREFLQVTDADLERSRPPSDIAMLSLGGTAVTDVGLAQLERYPNLTWLNLAGTGVTDSGLQHVARLKDLEVLYLTGTKVTDAGVRALEGLPKLTLLDVAGTRVTDDGWSRLRRAIPNLKAPE